MTIAFFFYSKNQNYKINHALFNVAKITLIDFILMMLSCFEREFFLIAFCQVRHHNKFIFHFHIAFSFFLHHFHLFALFCFCFQTCFHLISLRLLSTNSKIDTHCTQSIKFVVSNSRCE